RMPPPPTSPLFPYTTLFRSAYAAYVADTEADEKADDEGGAARGDEELKRNALRQRHARAISRYDRPPLRGRDARAARSSRRICGCSLLATPFSSVEAN